MSRTFRYRKYSTESGRDGKCFPKCKCNYCYGAYQQQKANTDRNQQYNEEGLPVRTRDVRNAEKNNRFR